jgi:hypothetical protein
LPKPAEPRFPLSSIILALIAAGIPEPDRERIVKQLHQRRPKRGRKEVADSDALSRVLDLVDLERGVGFNMAASIVAREAPESQRDALRKRLARKARAIMGKVQEELDEATRVAIERGKEEKAELERLRKRVAELESKPEARKRTSFLDSIDGR